MQDDSIPIQRAINRETARRHNLEIVHSIELADVSGAAVLLTSEVQDMLRRMADPEIHGVIVREFSRLMRPENFADYAMLQAFLDTDTWLYTSDGPINFATNDGFLVGTMKAVMGGIERREIVKKLWNSKETKRRAGGFSQGKVCLPFGVDFSDGKWSYTADAERVREAFRLFLSGEISYATIGRRVLIDPYSLRVIMRNPIYTGWRVIDKRRDPSPGAKMTKADGRQGDRRKIVRAPEDVIRVKVLDALISESDFARVQELIQAKKLGHWRLKEGFERRFTYHGFISCECQSRVYTKYRRDDYYVCKAGCGAKYMRRDRLEPRLDRLFTTELTSIEFLEQVYASTRKNQPQVNVEALSRQLEALTSKRLRILDTYFEGVINGTERDLRLAAVEREKQTVSRLLDQRADNVSIQPATLAEMFSPFVEFDLLNRNQKRRLLTVLTPNITAMDYRVSGISFVSMGSHKDRDS